MISFGQFMAVILWLDVSDRKPKKTLLIALNYHFLIFCGLFTEILTKINITCHH